MSYRTALSSQSTHCNIWAQDQGVAQRSLPVNITSVWCRREGVSYSSAPVCPGGDQILLGDSPTYYTEWAWSLMTHAVNLKLS